jgi:hypothetical protein
MVVSSKDTYKVKSSPEEAKNIIPTMESKIKPKYSPLFEGRLLVNSTEEAMVKKPVSKNIRLKKAEKESA